ncbi:MAG TPA: DUF1292 domain-containing protein [Candidatus Anaerostipes excrementavium]|uniref:DUF1292 domain-containing protein n=1 Tax=Candidatus Anaerostipes excrementavium TaxID=2838463 RepID=A0A9D2B9P2_9FIRM|nr:DUF1292 domain-containing protein [uncultured Anaerostipes sp.]HIX68068.1 DUF1292 domain-containing protein [Candidatus Anaerostipes excrementavium]
MGKNENQILLLDDEGNEIELYVLEQTTLAGKNYLLTADSMDDDGVVMIMKEAELEDDMVSYEFVEDEEELKMISSIFNELTDEFEVRL